MRSISRSSSRREADRVNKGLLKLFNEGCRETMQSRRQRCAAAGRQEEDEKSISNNVKFYITDSDGQLFFHNYDFRESGAARTG